MSPLFGLQQKRQKGAAAGRFFSSIRLRRWFLAVFVFFIVTATLAMDFYKVEELKVGMPSPADYRAPRTVDYIDEEKTEELRETAARLVEPVYDPDLVVNNEVLAELGQSFLTIGKSVPRRTWRKMRKGSSWPRNYPSLCPIPPWIPSSPSMK